MMQQYDYRSWLSEADSSTRVFLLGLLFLYFVLPFSLAWEWQGHELLLPAEPLLIILAVFICWQFPWRSLHTYFANPITWFGLGHICLMLLSCLWSVSPLTTLKYAFIEACQWLVFYLGFLYLFTPSISKQKPDIELAFQLILGLYLISFAFIMLYAWYHHAAYDFSIDTSVLTARPFYFDHALYGSCAALLLGPSCWALFHIPNRIQRIVLALLTIVLGVSIYLSFSRAVWLSILLASVLTVIQWALHPGLLRWAGLSLLTVIVLSLSFPLWENAILGITSESKTGSITEQLSSIGNITTDVSNLERLNRYSCAWRMFQDRPVSGFGAGTFANAYLPYQRPHETTRISVFSSGPHPPGRGGGAHSEYLQSLAERGLPGLLLWLGLIISVFALMPRVLNHSLTGLSLSLFFSLNTFFIHGLFNNFLHQGKLASLFWCLLATLTLLTKGINKANA